MRRPGQAPREGADAVGGDAVSPGGPDIRQPEIADAVTVAVIPLAVPGGEVADLPPVGPDIPGLGDHLDALQLRVVEDGREQWVVLGVAARGIPPERDGQVEPEAVDLHLVRPVAQRVEHQLLCRGQGEVHRVAASGHIDVLALLVHPVVARIVEPAERVGRTGRPLLGGVVVDDVEHDLEARLVQCPHHGLELAQHGAGSALLRLRGRVLGVRREEVERVVAPVVRQPLLDQPLLAQRLVHRQQLHGRDAEILEVGDGALVRETRVGAAELLGHGGVELGQSFGVRLVQHGVVKRNTGLLGAAPVKRAVLHVAAPVSVACPRQPPRVGVEQVATRVEPVGRPTWAARSHRVARPGN